MFSKDCHFRPHLFLLEKASHLNPPHVPSAVPIMGWITGREDGVARRGEGCGISLVAAAGRTDGRRNLRRLCVPTRCRSGPERPGPPSLAFPGPCRAGWGGGRDYMAKLKGLTHSSGRGLLEGPGARPPSDPSALIKALSAVFAKGGELRASRDLCLS